MKFTHVFLLSLSITFCIKAQEYVWQPLNGAPYAGRHDDISFINENLGGAVNSSGEIYKTTNGGKNWMKQFQSDSYFRSVGFANDSVGWAGTVDSASILYLTIDGGSTWTEIENIPEPKPKRICGMSVINDSTMYACGAFDGTPRFIKTTDRGKTWTVKDMYFYVGTLIDIYFLDSQRGFLVGGNKESFPKNTKPMVIYTDDGGNTWKNRFVGKNNGWCWKIAFPTQQIGYISVEVFDRAYVLKTTNGGFTWTEKEIPDNYDIQGIGFINANVGWVGGYGNTSITTDGGNTWHLVDFGERLNRFRIFNDTLAYASGRTLYKFTHSEVTAVDEIEELPNSFLLEQNYPNPFNLSTTINYYLPEAANVKIRIFNSLGQDVITLTDEFKNAGSNSVIWNGKNSKGDFVSSGTSLYRIDAGNNAKSKTMLLLK